MSHPETQVVENPIGAVWLDVLMRLFIRCQIGGFPEGFDWPEADAHLRTLNQSHISAAIALSELRKATALEEETREGDAAAHVGAVTRQRSAVHAFLVAADSFFDAFEALARVLPKIDEVKLQSRAVKSIAKQTRDARDHEEHRTERVRKGRSAIARTGRKPMSAEEFRSAPGVIDGTRVTYGDETFDLEEIYRAIERVGEVAGRRLLDVLTLSATATHESGALTVQFGSSVADDPFLKPLPKEKRKWEGRPPWSPPPDADRESEG